LTMKYTKDINSTIYQESLAIRKEVFMNEQQVPLSIEVNDEDKCIHFVLYEDGVPQATVRLYPKSKDTFKIQRMAVLKSARNKGFGQYIMTEAEKYAQKIGMTTLILGAQTHALSFYEKMGYKKFGDEYVVSKINHYNMKKTL
ncbi:GNAT family N-acetyltransferase, partial [Vagococcus sp.]|uniref:GNAT family N-acetyltransferase n=1 Tax=Vagococcus sp. TaxID=1933889 RepID=UPI002FC63A8A